MFDYLKSLIVENVGNKICPVCGAKNIKFEPLPKLYLTKLKEHRFKYTLNDFETLNFNHYSCPVCSASDRDRLFALYISLYLKNQEVRNIKMLEIAPSKPLSKYIKNTGRIKLRTSDLYMKDVDDHVDIMDMHCYKDEEYDSFICSHVLEHVTDDNKALRELYRVLKVDGWGILMVPIVPKLINIDEAPFLKDQNECWRRFGQGDHVRLYSKHGFMDRVEKAGFKIEQCGNEYFGKNIFSLYGISQKSILYIVMKD